MSGLLQDLFELLRYDNIQINMHCIQIISINIKYEINQKINDARNKLFYSCRTKLSNYNENVF